MWGHLDAVKKLGHVADEIYDGGCLEWVQDMLNEVPLIGCIVDRMCELMVELNDGFPGIFEYEVCEAYGEWYTRRFLEGCPLVEERVRFIEKECFQFFKDMGHDDRVAQELKLIVEDYLCQVGLTTPR